LEKFLTYFENKSFVRWVLHPNEQLNTYWKNYIKKNPQEQKEIEFARLLVVQLQSKKEGGATEEEAIGLLSDIIQQIEITNRKKNFRRITLSLLKYAAVALVFFFLGISYYYFQKTESFSGLAEQMYPAQDVNSVQLILGDGINVPIDENESTVEYRSDGQIVINSRDTVPAKSDRKAQKLNQLVIPHGKNSSILLPDGTVAYLNAGSRLVYPNFFRGKNREVFLIGEGFFEVTHDESMPFIVQTTDLNVEVLGTRFNVSAYPSDNMIETVLVEGKVKISPKGVQLLKNDYTIEPNQLASYNRTSAETKISDVDISNYVTWHNGYLNFNSSDLSRIVKRLERYYNIKIILDDPMLGIRSITGKLHLKDETEYVLKVLAKTASADLKQLNETTYVLM
jgi:transmembrane sensor